MKFYTTSKLSENMHETPEGYLLCLGVSIARTGEMIYGPGETPLDTDDSGQIVISRTSNEVFRPETIASFQAKPFVIFHPEDFVTPENWGDLAKGILQNVRRGSGEQENDLIADILVTDGEAIKLIREDRLREVSCGYEAEYIETGIGRGVQKNIIGNHLALVQEGRAGSSYSINDHNGVKMKLSEKIKAIFAKAQDEALKAATEDKAADMNTETPEKVTGFVSYDDFKKAMDDFGSKMDAFMGGKGKGDASTKPDSTSAAEIEAKDEGEESEEEKKKKARDAYIDAMMAKDAEEMEAGDEDPDNDGDVHGEGEDAYDDDEEEGSMVGDAKSRIEILAPGMKGKGKDAKVKALKVAYGTKDGKAAIDLFTGGKAPDYKNAKVVDAIFIGAAEVLKGKRSKDLSAVRTTDFNSNLGQPKGKMTPEDLNEINKKFYEKKA